MSTPPHEGYTVLRRLGDFIKSKQESEFNRFFCFTSNIDRALLFSATARENELEECHGNLMQWSCSVPCSDSVWNAPLSLRFIVDPNTRRCSGVNERRNDFPVSQDGFPQCKCGALARPAILMFEDSKWVRPTPIVTFESWKRDCIKYLRRNSKSTLAILEIGAGDRIPTVRTLGEEFINTLYSHAELWEDPRNEQSPVKAKLIRINPDYPAITRHSVAHLAPYVISVPTSAREALRQLEQQLK